MAIINFKLILPSMASALVTNNNKTSKMQSRIIIPQVLDKNRSVFLISIKFL